MPHYALDMSRHVKIWFSPNPEVFMPELHQWRLRDIRARYPDIQLALIYSEACLDVHAQPALLKFCHQYKISAHSLEQDPAFTKMCARQGYQLYTYALAELAAFRLKKGGNLAAASYLVRWLIPTLGLGVYSDLDVNITVKPAQLQFYSNTPLLLNVGQDPWTFNNDIIAFLGGHQERGCIYKMHTRLQSAYEVPVAYLQGNKTYLTECDYFFGDVLALLFSSETYIQIVQTFSVPQLRLWIENNILKDTKTYMHAHDFMQKLSQPDNQTEDEALFFVLEKKRILREYLQSVSPDNEKIQHLIQCFLSIETASDFLEKYFSYVQQQTRIGLVTYFSGAPQLMCLKDKQKGMASFSFWRQYLEDCFTPFGVPSDLAWLPGAAGKQRWEQHQVAALKQIPSWVAHQVEVLRCKSAVCKIQQWVRKTVQPQLYSLRIGKLVMVSAQSSQQSLESELSVEAATTGDFLKKLDDIL